MEISKSNVSASVDKFDHVSINTLSPKWQVCHSSVPSSVAIVQHFTDLVGGFLVRHTLVSEDKHDVAVLALNKVFTVGAQVVLPAGMLAKA
jgi:hypothetical protein